MNIEELISQYIDGSLSSEAEAELHHRLAVSPEARRLFRTHIMLRGIARDQRVLHTPAPDVRSKLFDRLVQEEGMKPAAVPVPIVSAIRDDEGEKAPEASPQPVAPSVPSLRQDRPAERRRRRVLPWLIPSMIAGMLFVVVWNSDWLRDPSATTVETTGGELADGGAGRQGKGAVERMEGTEQNASSGAGETPAAGSVTAGSGATGQGATDQSVTNQSGTGQAARESSSPSVANPVANAVADAPSRAVERPVAKSRASRNSGGIAAYDASSSRPRTATSSTSSRAHAERNIGGGSSAPMNYDIAMADMQAANAPMQEAATESEVKPTSRRALATAPAADAQSSAKHQSSDGSSFRNERSSNGASRFDRAIDSAISSNRSSSDMARAETLENTSAIQTESALRQNSLMSPSNGTQLNSSARTSLAETVQLSNGIPSSQEGTSPSFNIRGEKSQDMALSAPPPPPAAPLAMPRIDGRELSDPHLSADTAAPSLRDPAPVALIAVPASAQAKPVVITVGLQQNSLVSLASSDVQLQVLIRAGVEFGEGDHQIFGIVSGGQYQESFSDSLVGVMYNGQVLSPSSIVNNGATPGMRAGEEDRSELWVGGGYRFSREIAEGWRVGVGVWSGAGERYIRLASELPVAYQPARWIRIELLPTIQYTTAYGETTRVTTLEFDPSRNYSEKNERTVSLARENDINLGIGIGASVIW